MAVILNSNSQTFGNLAVDKLKAQAKDFSSVPIVKDGVLAALILFCKQSEVFAQKVYESDKSFVDCMITVLRNKGSCLSDIEAYRRAVCYYFDKADVEFEMKIILPERDNQNKKAVILNLFDIL